VKVSGFRFQVSGGGPVGRITLILLLLATLPMAQQNDAAELTDKGSRDLPGTQRDDGPPPTPSASADGAPELTAKASHAINKGLKYLLANQRADGSWASTESGDRAVAITSLALMAFMSKAEFPGAGPNGAALDKAKDWLLAQAKDAPDGYLGSTMYEHGLAILALTEMWGMTQDPKDEDAMQKAIKAGVEVIIRSQSDGGGWRYQPTPTAGHDTSVTVMVFIALASARQAGVVVPNSPPRARRLAASTTSPPGSPRTTRSPAPAVAPTPRNWRGSATPRW
jgi:hypothetical protein